MIKVTNTYALQFTLQNKFFAYSLAVFDERFLCHLYWGKPLSLGGRSDSAPSNPPAPSDSANGNSIPPIDPRTVLIPCKLPYAPYIMPKSDCGRWWPDTKDGYALNSLPLEFPAWGAGDTQEGAFGLVFADGTSAARLEYAGYEIVDSAVQPQGMEPLRSADTAAGYSTLLIRLVDARGTSQGTEDPRGGLGREREQRDSQGIKNQQGGLVVELMYMVSDESPALIRWARYTNAGSEPFLLKDPASVCLTTPTQNKKLVSLQGAWGRERHIQQLHLGAGALTQGQFSIASINGASGHNASPFIAIADSSANEFQGSVHALALVYSGNFRSRCTVNEHGFARVDMGIPKFRKRLEPQASFDSPCAVLVHSQAGFSLMSERFHSFIRKDIAPKHRPIKKIIINSWEAMYFDISEEKILALAGQGRDIGAELLVLDDGWFSKRRSDTSSLGDWWYNTELFPQGIGRLAERVREEGLEFGLWIEPEMVSPNSELYRKHPEWAIRIAGREPTPARDQLVLDLSNEEVVEYLFETITSVLKEAKPLYIKWDMNRNISEAGSPALSAQAQGELFHRYILGLYRLIERIQVKFPNLIIEGCAGGGGRFDLGLARLLPRFWTSDQTDAVERLPIQYGTSLVFPPETMGAHVSAVPNHQVGRATPALTRCLTALPFSYGYELDPARCSQEECKLFAQFSHWHKQNRDILHSGDFIRLLGPFDALGNGASGAGGGSSGASSGAGSSAGAGACDYAWMIRSANARELYIFYFQPMYRNADRRHYLAIRGLDSSAFGRYRDRQTERIYPVELLAEQGLFIERKQGDYLAEFWHLTAVESTG